MNVSDSAEAVTKAARSEQTFDQDVCDGCLRRRVARRVDLEQRDIVDGSELESVAARAAELVQRRPRQRQRVCVHHDAAQLRQRARVRRQRVRRASLLARAMSVRHSSKKML